MEPETRQPTLGEERVRLSFNSGIPKVEHIKSKFAELIDFCEGTKHLDPRLAATAQTAIELAEMWTVKLITTPEKIKAPTTGATVDTPEPKKER